MATVWVYSSSKVIVPNDVLAMVLACNVYIKQLCKAWNILPITVSRLLTPPTTQNYVFYIVDDTPPAGTLGFHTEIQNRVLGYVYAKTILANGGVPLYKDTTTLTVASILFHEIAEAVIDPYVNLWWQQNLTTYVAGEVCDPVEGPIIPTIVSVLNVSTTVGLCDFIFPLWYNPEAPVSSKPVRGYQYNYANTLSAPFSVLPTGYITTLNIRSGRKETSYSEKVPEWRKDMHQNSERYIARTVGGTEDKVDIKV